MSTIGRGIRVYFSVQYYSYIGGAESQLIKQMKYYEGNFDTSVITQGEQCSCYLTNKFKFALFCLRLAFYTLTSRKGDIFYFIGAGTEKIFFHFVNSLKPHNVKYIVKFPGTFDAEFERYYLQRLQSFNGKIIHCFFEHASAVIVQDRLSFQYIAKYFDSLQERVTLIHNGVETTENLHPKLMQKPAKVLFVGRMIALKGIFYISEIARRFNESCEFHLIGEGPDLTEAKEKAHCAPNIFFHGHQPHEVVEKFYDEADLFLFPSRFREGLPNVVFEAMSHCLPVIATKVGALPELFEDRNQIIFLEMDNLTARHIEDAINLLIRDENLRKKIASNGYRKMIDNFTVKQAAQKNIDLIEKIFSEA